MAVGHFSQQVAADVNLHILSTSGLIPFKKKKLKKKKNQTW